MKTIKAVLGNLISRLTGSNVLVDEEWNAKQWKSPNKKSWFNLLVVFPILLIILTLLMIFFIR